MSTELLTDGIDLVAVLLLGLGIKGLSKVRSAAAPTSWRRWPWAWPCWAC